MISLKKALEPQTVQIIVDMKNTRGKIIEVFAIDLIVQKVK
jgi:hypothetical protein